MGQGEEMEFLEPGESWSPGKAHCQKTHPRAAKDFSFLLPICLLLVELNRKAGSKGAKVMHVGIHGTGQRRMESGA